MSQLIYEYKKREGVQKFNELSRISGISIGYLQLMMYGVRRVSIQNAIKLENASREIGGMILEKEKLIFGEPLKLNRG